ncbi:MAG: DNA polymerase III subunit alpha, partial [Bacteroidota bacterium]|nr:DNA polymerase III subunit alpha [Bacteroidota bacterium]
TLSIEALTENAKKLGIQSLVLTDINNSMAIPDFVKSCKEKGIKPIAGMEFRNKDNRFLYFAIAKNNKGFKELNDFISNHNINKTEITTTEFTDAYVIYPFGSKKINELKENEFIGVKPKEITKLIFSEYRQNQSKLIIQQPVSFRDNNDFELHKHLRAIDRNILLSQLTQEQLASPDEVMLSQEKLLKLYKDYPQIVKNTEKLITECSIDFEYKSNKNKATFTGSKYDDKLLLEKLAFDGLLYRYEKNNKEAIKRIKHELKLIDELNFSAYFLIAWDIIRYSMSRGFYHVGRGSGANSIVAYCLKITNVDPIELNLYFERFINPKRSSPPDFDIDYSWKERNEVTDYIFKRYGKEHTALLGATTTFKGRSTLRELAKIYGLPKSEIDALVKNPESEKNKNHISEKIINIGKMMLGFPNIRSIHAGGILISEKPLSYYTAVDMPPKGYPTTQWDMYVAESLGFEKFDILSQRGIGHINDCANIILENKNIKVDVHQINKFKEDKKIKEQLKNAETCGCFYIESPAMRGLLKKLKCDNYISLVAASSIIRPGVAKSGMMKEYIYRFHNPNNFKYIHPIMEEELKETYGVMVYQEDVLKVCHHFAGLDLADSDVLRRAMSGKFRSKKEFQRIVEKFFNNCNERGYPPKITQEVWRQIESFGGYSFSKAHSASYAVESLQSLYLKTYFPLEFMVAVINNFGGFYHTWVYVNEAQRQGANIELPCVNNSSYLTTIIDKNIFLGFIHIANFEKKQAEAIEQERKQNGKFQSLKDFSVRIDIKLEQIIILIKINAFRFTAKTKVELLWEAHLLLGKKETLKKQSMLFYMPSKKFELPKLETGKIEDAYDEIEMLGFTVSLSFFDLLKTSFRGEIQAKDLDKNVGRKVRMIGRLVTIKYVRTVKKEIMHFGTFVDKNGVFFDTTHFPDSLRKYPFRGSGMYLLLGKVVEEFGYASIEVYKQAKLPIVADPREK